MITDTYPQMASALISARNDIFLLSNAENKQMVDKITTALTQHINSLTVFSGNFPVTTEHKSVSGQPLTKIMGRHVIVQPKEKNVSISLKQHMDNIQDEHNSRTETQTDIEFLEIEKKRDDLYDSFLEMETDKIKDDQPELIIRGVAKKAGIPVTNTLPEKITTEFIDQVKDAIKKKKQIDDIANAKKSEDTIKPMPTL